MQTGGTDLWSLMHLTCGAQDTFHMEKLFSSFQKWNTTFNGTNQPNSVYTYTYNPFGFPAKRYRNHAKSLFFKNWKSMTVRRVQLKKCVLQIWKAHYWATRIPLDSLEQSSEFSVRLQSLKLMSSIWVLLVLPTQSLFKYWLLLLLFHVLQSCCQHGQRKKFDIATARVIP